MRSALDAGFDVPDDGVLMTAVNKVVMEMSEKLHIHYHLNIFYHML